MKIYLKILIIIKIVIILFYYNIINHINISKALINEICIDRDGKCFYYCLSFFSPKIKIIILALDMYLQMK